MRRILLFLMLILASIHVWATENPVWTNNTTTQIIEAYKNAPPSAMMKFDITISNSKQTSITGSNMSDLVTSDDVPSEKMDNALTFTVDTNRRSPITIDLWFSPFIAGAEAGNVKVSTTWTLEETSSTEIDHETVTDEDTQETYNRYFAGDGNKFYKYGMGISLKNKNGSAVTSVTASTTAGVSAQLIFTPKAWKNTRNTNGWAGNWTAVSNIPTTETGVLPGIVENSTAAVHAVARFSMTLGTSYSQLKPDTSYRCTVRILVQGD